MARVTHKKTRMALRRLMSRSNYVVLECGAGPRLMSNLGLPRARKVILVDPVKELLDRYRELLPKNKKTEAIFEFHEFAVGKEEGFADFHLPHIINAGEFGSGHGSLLPRKGKSVSGKWATRRVEVKPLSSIDQGDIDIAVIDMEGSECDALDIRW